MRKIIVGPVELLPLISARLAATPLPSGLRLGEPALEPAGVAGRRGAVAHNFSAEDWADIQARLSNPDYAALQILDQMPADWRYPSL